MRMKSNEGLWVVPSRGVHTFGLMFPIDVIYLDANLQVIDLVEGLAPLRIAPLRLKCASVLQLPARSVCDSGTQAGDHLSICSPEEMERYLTLQSTEQRRAEQQPGRTNINEARPA
jgi:uncharacterized membrane protein (UPF0127 family)